MKYLKKINELYQEEDDSTFTHDGNEYSINKLLFLTKNIKPKYLNIEDLKWILNFTKTYPKRIQNANINVPIIVIKSNNRLVVLDGAHRLKKSIELGNNKIPSIEINEDILSRCKL